MRPSRTPLIAVAAAALGFTIGGAVIAVAAIPSADGTITACYDSGGNVKLIDEGKGCPKGYKGPISWNQAGEPGEDGVSGRVVVENRSASTAPNRTARCPEGKQVIGGGGGGFYVTPAGITMDISILQSQPVDIDSDLDPEGWRLVGGKQDGTELLPSEQFDIRVFAICVDAN